MSQAWGVKTKPVLDNHVWKTQRCDSFLRSSNIPGHLSRADIAPGAGGNGHRCPKNQEPKHWLGRDVLPLSELYAVSEFLNLTMESHLGPRLWCLWPRVGGELSVSICTSDYLPHDKASQHVLKWGKNCFIITTKVSKQT